MARSYDNTDTDADLMRDWEDTGVLQLREIRSHRAPRRPFPYKSILTASALAVIASSGVIVASRSLANQNQNRTFTVRTNSIEANELIPTPDILDTERVTRIDNQISRGFNRNERMAVQMPQIMRLWVSPVKGAKITSCWGMRNGRMHKGIDFALPKGRDIRSVGAGKVVQAGWGYRGLGYSVVVDHGDGYMTIYGHASKVLVKRNQQIKAGQLIARIGSTGNSTGPHLHFSVARTKQLRSIFNTMINPAPWLRSHDVTTGRCR